jgi:hypothetical protein
MGMGMVWRLRGRASNRDRGVGGLERFMILVGCWRATALERC